FLPDRQRVRGALWPHWAPAAQPLRGRLAQPATDPAKVIVGMEELSAGAVTAASDHLPLPRVTDGTQGGGDSGHFGHLLGGVMEPSGGAPPWGGAPRGRPPAQA